MSLLTRNLAVLTLLAAGCGPFSSSSDVEADFQHARKAADAGDARVAAALYQKALRKSPDSGRPHLELGLLYDEKLGDPIAAIYHYRQYLELEPNSDRRQIVEGYIERSKLTLAAKLPTPSGLDASELTRLQTEKATLMQENAALRSRLTELERAVPATGGADLTAVPPPLVVTQSVVVTPPSPVRSHVVQKGDTLQSIALRYYGTRSGWEKIYAANRSSLQNRDQLKIGQQLTIP